MITKLKIAIDKSGLKQTYIAKELGLCYATVSKFVCGTLTPDEKTLKKLAKILKTQTSDLQ